MASLLHDTPLNQFQQEAVRMITTSGDLLSTVVDDVLDYRSETRNLVTTVRITEKPLTMPLFLGLQQAGRG